LAISSLFIAADRSSAPQVAVLAADAAALGYRVEWDRQLPGGDAWWQRTLDAVERADALIYALTSSSVASAICQEQLRYALDLRTPVLPVLLVADVSDVDLPPSLGQIQRVDYQSPSPDAMAELFAAIRGLPPEENPSTPQVRPACPTEVATDLAARLATAAVLDRAEQEAVLDQLTRYVEAGFTAGELGMLTAKLHERRPDLTVLSSNRLDDLENRLSASSAPPPPPVPSAGKPADDGDPPVHSVFVSYSRAERVVVAELVDDLRRLGFTVWIDQNLPGGSQWWDQVLLNIRQADAFVFAAGQASMESRACRAELGYARQLGVPIVRLDVAPVDPAADELLAGVGVARYVAGDKASLAGVAQALRRLSRVAPPPVPPPPPQVPATYLFDVQSRLRSTTELDGTAQVELLDQISRYATEGVATADLRRLLDSFERRPEITMRSLAAVAALRQRFDIPTAGEAVDETTPPGALAAPAGPTEVERQQADVQRQRAEADEEARRLADAEQRRLADEAERQRLAAEPSPRRRRWAVLCVAGVLVAAGAGVAAFVAVGDDESTTPQTSPITEPDDTQDEPFVLPPPPATQPVVTEPAPGPDTVPAFAGVFGRAQVQWSTPGGAHTALIDTQGTTGVADVQFVDPVLGVPVIVREDLTLVNDGSDFFYEGSSPRLADGSPAVGYAPDAFRLTAGPDGRSVFDLVCDANDCFAATTTPG
jgi:DNA-binding transcriptional MerR regulator